MVAQFPPSTIKLQAALDAALPAHDIRAVYPNQLNSSYFEGDTVMVLMDSPILFPNNNTQVRDALVSIWVYGREKHSVESKIEAIANDAVNLDLVMSGQRCDSYWETTRIQPIPNNELKAWVAQIQYQFALISDL